MSLLEEKKNQRKSMMISIGAHALLLLLFFFILAWKEPFPPIPEYGIELNFGIDNQGSGITQTEAPVSPQPEEETAEEDAPVEQPSEEALEQPVEENIQPEDVTETAPPTETETVTEDPDSPDVTEEQINDNSSLVEQDNPVEEVQEQEDIPASVPAAPVIEENTNEEQPGGLNQGESEDEVGDQGDPEGELDERALYGNPGAGGGASLNMAGWMWDYIPKPDDRSQENGRIVFSITIDDQGEILSIKTLEKRGITPAVERIYRAEVERLTFSTTRDNTRPAPSSSGTITFIIKSN